MTDTASAFDKAAIGLGPTAALILILSASWVLPAAPLTALLGGLLVIYLLMSPARANGAALRIAAPFLLMAVWGLLLASGNDRYTIAKDFWYAGKLCLCLMVGFLVGIRPTDSGRIMRALVLLAGTMAVVTIVLWLTGNTRVGELDSEDASRLPLVATAAIIPLLDQLRDERGRRRTVAAGILLAIALAVLASNSRITLIAAGVMGLAWAGLLSQTRRALLGGLAVAAVITLLWHFLPEYSGGELTVAIKLRRSIDELLFTDSFDSTQMILNWRGFEAYNAQLMFDQSSTLRKLFGNGLGATVDLGQEVAISDEASYRFIPILHNGFYYILIKCGVVGVIVYTYAIIRFGLLGRSSDDNLSVEDRMLRGSILLALLATLVITGLYNKTELNGLTLFIGWLIGFAQRRLADRSLANAPLPVAVTGQTA